MINSNGLNRCKADDCPNKSHGEIYIPCDRILEVSRTYTIIGVPVPLRRPRFSQRKVYDSQKQEKLLLSLGLRNQHNDDKPFNGILHLDVTFCFPYPKEKGKRKMLEHQFYHTYKPDLSNLIKMVEDVSVDAGLITDDAIIASVFSVKLYGDEPRTSFIITNIKSSKNEE